MESKKFKGQFLNTDEKVDHYERLAVFKADQLQKSDQDFNTLVSKYSEENIDKFKDSTDDQQVVIMRNLNAFHDFSRWLMGEYFNIIEDAIQSGRKIGYKNKIDWFTTNQEKLNMSRTTFYDCMTVRNAIKEKSTFEELGIARALIAAKVKDDKTREQVIQKAITKDLKVEELRDYVANIDMKEKEYRRENKKKEEQKINREFKINVEVVGKTKLSIEFDNEDERDAGNTALLQMLPDIKKRMKSCLD